MLLEKNGNLHPTEQYTVYQFGTDRHYVSGFCFVRGCSAGEESCAFVQTHLEKTGRIPFEHLYGAYTYCLRRADGETFFFPSNGQLSCLYISDHAVTNSYKEHLDYRKAHGLPLTFDAQTLCEYYTLGRTFFGHTLVKEVTLLPHGTYVHFKNDSYSILEKGIGTLNSKCTMDDPALFFSDLAKALQNIPSALALTGGYDSRMIYAHLYDKVPLELFLSCTPNTTSKDTQVAEQVANQVGQHLDICMVPGVQLTQEMIENLLEEKDYANPLILDMNWRHKQHKQWLKEQGIALHMTGDGGPLYKDWIWSHELPFYRKKKTDFHKLYRLRICAAPDITPLSQKLRACYDGQEQRFVQSLDPYRCTLNTESLDAFTFYVTGQWQSMEYNLANGSLIPYTPLLELDMVRYSFHLPRRKRFFNQFQREFITAGNRKIACVPTDGGPTASSQLRYELRDIYFQCVVWGQRFLNLMSRKLLHHSSFVEKVNPLDSFEQQLRGLPVCQEALEWAIAQQILAPTNTVDQLPYGYLQHTVHLYLMAQKYDIEF